MKFERKHRNIIIIAIAVFFILYGLLNMVFNFNIDKELEDKVSWILTIIAVALLFSGTKPKFNKSDEANNSELENTEGNQSDPINTANSIEADSEVNAVEGSDLDGITEEQDNADTDNKDN